MVITRAGLHHSSGTREPGCMMTCTNSLKHAAAKPASRKNPSRDQPIQYRMNKRAICPWLLCLKRVFHATATRPGLARAHCRQWVEERIRKRISLSLKNKTSELNQAASAPSCCSRNQVRPAAEVSRPLPPLAIVQRQGIAYRITGHRADPVWLLVKSLISKIS